MPEGLQGEGKLEAFIRGWIRGKGMGEEGVRGERLRECGGAERRRRIEEFWKVIQRQIRLLEEGGTGHLNLVERDARRMRMEGGEGFG